MTGQLDHFSGRIKHVEQLVRVQSVRCREEDNFKMLHGRIISNINVYQAEETDLAHALQELGEMRPQSHMDCEVLTPVLHQELPSISACFNMQ